VVSGVGTAAKAPLAHSGIVVGDCASVRIAGNTVIGVAPPDEFVGISAGIGIVDAFEQAAVLDNSVTRADGDPPAEPHSSWFGIFIGGAAHGVLPERAFIALGKLQLVVATARRVPLPRRPASLAVRGNVVAAYGTAPAVHVEAAAPALFSDNRCRLAPRKGLAVAEVQANAVVASGNHLDGGGVGPGLALTLPDHAPLTALGNIAPGGLFLNGTTPLPAPWHDLNNPT
jgi:hypothetical protein